MAVSKGGPWLALGATVFLDAEGELLKVTDVHVRWLALYEATHATASRYPREVTQSIIRVHDAPMGGLLDALIELERQHRWL